MKDVSLYLNNHGMLLAVLLLIIVVILMIFSCIILFQKKRIMRLKNECDDLNRQIEIKDNRIWSLKRERSERIKPSPAEITPVKLKRDQDGQDAKAEELIVKVDKTPFLGHPLKLFATAYDSESKCFFNVDKKPTADSIFEITINPHNESDAYLDLYTGALEKIIDCKDFLNGCCEQIGYGDKMEILDRGELILQEGVWKIKKMMKIKFS